MEKKISPGARRSPRVQGRLYLLLLGFLFSVFYFEAQAQTNVSGIVRDNKGTPLEGVSVSIKGSSIGNTTDSKGAYSIPVANSNAVLVFSFIGFGDKEESIKGRTNINVELLSNVTNLDEVIVVGYGTQKKRDVTGAISSINAKTIEEKQPVTIFDAIQGAAPGVRVMSESGAPGEEADITIRGISTLSDAGVRPLYVVD